jgi:hypothetical protein
VARNNRNKFKLYVSTTYTKCFDRVIEYLTKKEYAYNITVNNTTRFIHIKSDFLKSELIRLLCLEKHPIINATKWQLLTLDYVENNFNLTQQFQFVKYFIGNYECFSSNMVKKYDRPSFKLLEIHFYRWQTKSDVILKFKSISDKLGIRSYISRNDTDYKVNVNQILDNPLNKC